VLRLFGEQGEVGFTFLRRDPHGTTAIGDDVVSAVDIQTLDAQLDALLAQQTADHIDHSEYPVMRLCYFA